MNITPGQNILNPYDLADTFEELSEEYKTLLEAVNIANAELLETPQSKDIEAIYIETFNHLDSWKKKNLDTLRNLQETLEAINNHSYIYETMVLQSYFPEYIKYDTQLNERVDFKEWPYNCIDWEKAIKRWVKDYVLIDYAGFPYYILKRGYNKS